MHVTRIAAAALGIVLLAGCSGAPAASTSTKAPAATTPAAAKTSATTSAPASTPAAQPSTSGSAAAASYTMAQVAEHKSADSCWSAISGNVYDLTAWIKAHPGGASRITGLCGIDGTSQFTGAHGSRQSIQNRLATFKLGPLK